MNRKEKTTLIPKLRFSDFKDEWKKESLGIYLKESRIKGNTGDVAKKLTVKLWGKGVFEKQEAFRGSKNTQYFCRRTGQFIYSKLDFLNQAFGIIPEYLDGYESTVDLPCFDVSNQLDSKFLLEYVQRPVFYKYYGEIADGGRKAKRIQVEAFLNFPISTPTLPEQQKIAACLSSLDDLIAAEDKKLEGLKAHKKGLMQKLFPEEGRTVPAWRFSEFRDSGEWKAIRLIDVTDRNKKWSFSGGPFGSNLKASDYTNDGIRVIQLQNIGDGKFIDTYKVFTSKSKADELLSCNIYPNEIILSKMGTPVGRACLIPNTHARYLMCSDGIRLVVDENNHVKYFIYSLLNSTAFRLAIENNSTGSTRKRIGLDVLKNLIMFVPKERTEQQKIADCLSNFDDLIAAQMKKNDTLKAYKKGLIQGLFPSVEEVSK